MTDPNVSATSEDYDVTDTPPVTRACEGIFHGEKVPYLVTAGRLPIPGPSGEVDAQMFFAAYTRDQVPGASRPLVFFTNGGPGAATAWLHAGGLGPRRLVMNDDGSTPPPPARMVDNADCALDVADLVFVDAPGTGYSRAASEEAKSRLFNRDGDLDAYAQFVLRYLRKFSRWSSPIYLFGESYGGTRVAALADLLVRRGVPVSGVVLLSSALDFHLMSPALTNALPFVMMLPTMASIAAYHGRIPNEGDEDGNALRQEAQAWAETVYHPALLKAARLGADEREKVVTGLVRYTGLPEAVVRVENLRIDTQVFMKYLLADRGVTTGRTDGRIVGPPVLDRVEEPFYDPAMGDMTPAFSSAANQLLGDELEINLDLPYRMYSRDVGSRFVLGQPPKWGNDGYPQSLTALQAAFAKNPAFRILSLQAIYDLAAPYRSSEYALDHLPVTQSDFSRITNVRLAGGHMSYTDAKVRQQVGHAFAEFVRVGLQPK